VATNDADELDDFADAPEEPADASAEASLEVSADALTEARAPYRQCAQGYHRVRLHLSYDGTDFAGWQRQTKLTSVQGELEKALSRIFAEPIRVLGASRTDAGVHARRQVAHFDCPRDPEGFEDLRYSIQSMTPDSIGIDDLFVAPRDFHAIALVRDKIYTYRIVNRRAPDPLQRRFAHWVRFPLDLEYLREAARFLIGKQDFKGVQSTGTVVHSTVREIFAVDWQRIDDAVIEFSIRGDGFLKQMVRNVVGTLIDMNQSGARPEKMREILEGRDRRLAGPTAPPQGLYLKQVNYPDFVDNKCRKL
jgi:tRNA pseudouridine38-40 synthase